MQMIAPGGQGAYLFCNLRSPFVKLQCVQVKQTMARIKTVLTERALAEPSLRVRKLYMDKINAK
jgi:hypothetical protein